MLEHLGPVSPIYGRSLVPDLRGIQAIVPAGHLAAFVSLSRQFRLTDTFSAVCPSGGDEVATRLWALVLNQSAGRRALPDVGPWVEESPLHQWMPADGVSLQKDALSRALDVIYSRQEGEETAYRRVHAIQERAAQAVEQVVGRDPAHYFVYHDVCRIRYNGSHCDWAEPGHGAVNGRPHVGIGMVTGRKHHFPLLSLPVKGSLHDSKTVVPVSQELKGRGLQGLTMVMDRGFPGRKTIKVVRDAGFEVLVGCPESSKEVKRAVRRWTDEEVERPGQVVPRSSKPEHAQYYRGWDGELYGVKGFLVLALDPWRRTEERVSRDLMLREVAQGGWTKGKWSSLREELGPVAARSPGRRGWRVDRRAERVARRADGRFLLFTTNRELSAEEVVETYFQRDEVEKAFETLKGPLNMQPIRYRLFHHVDTYLTVICHLAYLLRAGLRWRLKEAGRRESTEEALEILREVYWVRERMGEGYLDRWGPLTKEKLGLIKALGLNDLVRA